MHASRKLQSLQLLRFAAAAMVVTTHAIAFARSQSTPVGWFAMFHLDHIGAMGVDLFFVISGFIITRAASGALVPEPCAFLEQRILRVVPIYFLMSLPFVDWSSLWQGRAAQQLFATYLFWPATAGGMTMPFLGVGWTLCFEMLFYVAMSFWLARPGRLQLGLLLGAYLAGCILRDLTGWPMFRFLGNPIIVEFLAGCLLAQVLPKLTGRMRRNTGIGALGLFAVSALVLLSFGFDGAFNAHRTLDGSVAAARAVLFGIPSLLLVLGALCFEHRARGHVVAALAFLGDASYSIYLTHPLVFRFLGQLPLPSPWPVAGDLIVILSVPLSLGAGALVYLCVERPLLQSLRARHTHLRKMAPVTAV